MPTPEIIYEDKNFIAVNKPAGLMVHSARIAAKKKERSEKQEGGPTLVDWLLERYPEIKTVGDNPAERPGIVHRLDKETSGVLIVARRQKTFEYLKSLFQKREVKKIYRALVFGKLKKESGIIDAPIGIKSGTLKRSIHSSKMAKEAVTEYKIISERPQYSLLEVSPRTGRTHQIRVHLASIGHPIVGDKLYGPKKQPDFATRLFLHALSISFTDETGKPFYIEAAPPLALSTGDVL